MPRDDAVAAGQAVDPDLLVNKGQVAQLLGITVPTLDKRLAAEPDFPVVERGSNGRAWAFRVGDVVAYETRRLEADEAENLERQSLLASLLPSVGDDDKPASLSPHQALAAARAAKENRRLLIESRLLVPTGEVKAALKTLLAALGQKLDVLPSQIVRRRNLPEELMFEMKRELDAWRQQAVAELTDLLSDEAAEPQKEMFG